MCAGSYIIDQEHTCKPCPKGATCADGASFESNAPGSEWEIEQALDGGLQRRILRYLHAPLSVI